MKLKKIRVCGNCKALPKYDPLAKCGLGYKTNVPMEMEEYMPKEKCPKPLTIKEFIHASKKQRN